MALLYYFGQWLIQQLEFEKFEKSTTKKAKSTTKPYYIEKLHTVYLLL